ncbi:MAG: electron transfer flavoprotein subunit alpha/FixB family protein [Chthoniobacteraceae bacterium]
METILVLLHTESDGALAKSAFETIGAAQALGLSFVLGLVGGSVQEAANQVAASGAAQFLAVEGADFATPRYGSDAAAVEALVKASGATIVLAPGTSRWNRVLSGAAQRLGGRVDTHVTGLAAENGALSVSRWYYRQRMEAQLSRTQRPWIVVIDPGSQAVWQGESGAATLEAVAVALPDTAKRTCVTGIRTPAADAQTIRPDADLLFVAGAGWTKKQADGQTHVPDAEVAIRSFLNLTRASLGSSKSLVDIGGEGQAVLSFLTHLNQIGQTGATPRHPKGLSTCCHGEEPHAVGWRFIKERRAISLDANCGWARGKADVLYVADAFAVMAKVNELLSK